MADDAPPSSDGGENFTVKLESLGPIIVNTDGSMQRIPNWSEMPQSEKDKTMRLASQGIQGLPSAPGTRKKSRFE